MGAKFCDGGPWPGRTARLPCGGVSCTGSRGHAGAGPWRHGWGYRRDAAAGVRLMPGLRPAIRTPLFSSELSLARRHWSDAARRGAAGGGTPVASRLQTSSLQFQHRSSPPQHRQLGSDVTTTVPGYPGLPSAGVEPVSRVTDPLKASPLPPPPFFPTPLWACGPVWASGLDRAHVEVITLSSRRPEACSPPLSLSLLGSFPGSSLRPPRSAPSVAAGCRWLPLVVALSTSRVIPRTQ